MRVSESTWVRRCRGKAAWVLAVTVVVGVACGDEESSPSSLECGEGTKRSGKQCVPNATGGSGTGGSGGMPSGGSSMTGGGGSGGTTVGEGGEAGAGASGGADAGTGGEGTGGDGMAGGGMGGTTGGAGSGGAGMGGSGGTGGSVTRRTHWFAFRHDDGILAYDLETFPASTGSLLAGTGTLPANAWSPDGTKLAYVSGSLFVVDMTTRTIGTPLNLGAAAAAIEWSGDSQSLLLGTQPGAVTVIAVNQAAPIRRTITSDASVRAWAPSGNRLAYIDATGLNVVSVIAGTPGQPAHVMDGVTDLLWSKDGTRLAAWSQGELSIVNLSGGAPVVSDVTSPTATAPSVEVPSFSNDGSRLVFSGRQASDVIEFYVVNASSPSTATRVDLLGASDGFVGSYQWASNHSWVHWARFPDRPDGSVLCDLSGSTPVCAPFPNNHSTFQWVPGELDVLARNSASEIVLVDATQPAAAPLVVTEPAESFFSLGGPGSAIAYRTSATPLKLDDLAGASTPPATVTFPATVGRRAWTWSPDARFLGITGTVNPSGMQLHVARVEGVNASSAVAIHGPSNAFIVTPQWQP